MLATLNIYSHAVQNFILFLLYKIKYIVYLMHTSLYSFAKLPNNRTSNTLIAVISQRHSDNRVALTLYDWKLNTALQSVPISGAKGITPDSDQ